jgi:hypothetical protein
MSLHDDIMAKLGRGPHTLTDLSIALRNKPFSELVPVLEAAQRDGLVVKMNTSSGTVWTVR